MYEVGNIEENEQNQLKINKGIYSFLCIELILALTVSLLSVYFYESFGKELVAWWYFAVLSGLMIFILPLVTFFSQKAQKFALNLVLYVLFTIAFIHISAFFIVMDSSRLLLVSLCFLTLMIVASTLFLFAQKSIPSSLVSFSVLAISGGIGLIGFVIYTNIKFYLVFLLFLATLVYAYYMSLSSKSIIFPECGKMSDDSMSGAVRIWLEADLVLMKKGELLSSRVNNLNKCC